MKSPILKTDDMLKGSLQGFKVIDSLGKGMAGQVYHIKGSEGEGRDLG